MIKINHTSVINFNHCTFKLIKGIIIQVLVLTRWLVSSEKSSLILVVSLPPLVMINQNSPPNSLINVIQKIYNLFNGVISNISIEMFLHELFLHRGFHLLPPFLVEVTN